MSSDYLCDAGNSCLLIIDIQEKLTAAMPQKVTKRVISNTGILSKAAGQLDVPVIATAQTGSARLCNLVPIGGR